MACVEEENRIEQYVEDDIVPVEVRPFKHQVGGHTCVLQVGGSTICKPYTDREVWFYEHVPESLKSFIPTYLGKILKKRLYWCHSLNLNTCIPKPY